MEDVKEKIKQYCNSIIRNQRLSKQSKKIYNYVINSIPVSQIKHKDIARLVAYGEYKKMAKKRIALWCSVLRQFYKYHNVEFKNQTVITHNINHKLKKPFTREELKALISVGGDYISSVVYILFATALRVGELINSQCRVKDDLIEIDFVGKGKKSAQKLVIDKTDQRLVNSVLEFYKMENFTKRDYHYIWRQFRELKSLCEIIDSKKTIHSIRHSAAQQFYKMSGLNEASRILRHQTTQTTMIYINMDTELIIRSTNSL